MLPHRGQNPAGAIKTFQSFTKMFHMTPLFFLLFFGDALENLFFACLPQIPPAAPPPNK